MAEQVAPKREPKPIPFAWALVPVVALIVLLGITIIGFEGSGHLPLVLGAGVAGLVAWAHGYDYKQIQAGVLHAINLAMGAILILLVIGVLMGTWLAAGIVPALIAWGLELMSPSWFLPASCVVCSIVSLVSGSSWSTAGTVGLALIGVGDAMDIDPAMTAGAVISGAYFGDKLSPMSDTTNLAPAMAGTDLFTHIRHMMWTTGPAWVLAMIGFSILGAGFEGAADPGSVAKITSIIEAEFEPGLIHLAVPAIVAIMVWRRFPALPTLLVGALLGALLAGLRGVAWSELSFDSIPALLLSLWLAISPVVPDILAAAMSGYAPDTGSAEVDELLKRGGMESMANTVLLVLCAMSFGGIMEQTGQLRTLASKSLAAAKSTGSLIAATVLTALGVNILAADQYLAIVVPGRMYAAEYRERGLDPKNLSRALEDGGTITSPLIPWNTCGAFMSTTLGVATLSYAPYCFVNLLNPIIGVVLGFTGWTIARLAADGEPKSVDESG
ncbi:MAG: Na+/H+ antiporter NhaC [Enhygromyxa sp.]